MPPLLLRLALLSRGADAAPLVTLPADPVTGRAEALCGTAQRIGDLVPAPWLPPAPPGEAKQAREALDGVASVRTSANFALKWGDEAGVDEGQAAALLSALEEAWAVEMEEMGHPVPVGCDRYLLNVYVEDTGLWWSGEGGSFELRGSGAAGYFYSDPEGYPILVMSRASFQDADYAGMVGAHELYHAVQAATEAYPYAGISAWYWEATATWASGQVFPEVPDYAGFLFGYALLPWLPVDFFDYPDSGQLQEYHQYGAFIFPQFLTAQAADWTVVRDSWTQPDPGGDPLVALDTALEAFGTDVEAALGEMAAHNTLWDYEDQEIYAGIVEAAEEGWPDGDSVVATVGSAGTEGMVAAPAPTRPQRLGYNLVRVTRSSQDPVRIDFQGDASGSAGGQARWTLWVVEEAIHDDPLYHPVTLVDGAGSFESPAPAVSDALWLAVSVSSDTRGSGETFGWSYAVDVGGETDGGGTDGGATDGGAGDGGDPDEDPQACGCAGAGPATGLLGLCLAGLSLVTRRRRGLLR